MGGVIRTLLDGNVLPLFAHARAQSSCAAETFGRFLCLSIALQQCMFAMPLMLQRFSPPKPSGTPANAPPTSTNKSTKDASRFLIFTGTLVKTTNKSQHFRPVVDHRPNFIGKVHTCRKQALSLGDLRILRKIVPRSAHNFAVLIQGGATCGHLPLATIPNRYAVVRIVHSNVRVDAAAVIHSSLITHHSLRFARVQRV